MKQTEILSDQKTVSQFTRFLERLIICSPAKLRGLFFAFLALKKITNRVWNFCHAQMHYSKKLENIMSTSLYQNPAIFTPRCPLSSINFHTGTQGHGMNCQIN